MLIINFDFPTGNDDEKRNDINYGKNKNLIYKNLSYKIIGFAMEVHNELGPGFLEKVYENSMLLLLKENGIKAENQVPINVKFKNKIVGNYIVDILVEDKIILEMKTVDKINNIHKAQIINYLKATGIKLGIIINFANKSLEYERKVW